LEWLCQSGSWKKQENGGAKAWVNFVGNLCTPWCPIRASYNVSGILRNSAGDYNVYFSTPLADANFSVAGSAIWDTGAGGQRAYPLGGPYQGQAATTYVRIVANGINPYDMQWVHVQIFGN